MPAILEYLPYRKRDGTAVRRRAHAIPTSPATATPASASTCAAAATPTGVLHDEYLPQEQDDAVEVIAWLAAQPWCTGSGRHDRASPGAASTRSRSPPAGRPRSRRSSRSAPPTTATPTTSTTWAAACSIDKLSLGVDDARLQRAAARPGGGRRALARDVARAARARARPASKPGSRTSAATPSGSRARCARTTRAIECAGLRGRRLGRRLLERDLPRLLAGLPGPQQGR